VNCCLSMVVVVMICSNKDSSLKIEELKKYEDSQLDKGLMPEESDSMLVAFIVSSVLIFTEHQHSSVLCRCPVLAIAKVSICVLSVTP